MNRASDQFALPRQLRRRIERQLRKLFRRNVCSICGGPFKHNSTAGGLDAQGNVVLAGECCLGQVAKALTLGLYSELAESDKVFDDIVRRGGDTPITPTLNLLDQLWKNDDRDWFRRNEQRSHRVRLPFPGEADQEALDVPAGHAQIILLRQVEPGKRMRAAVHVSVNLLPVPDDEAAAHALFEAAMGREAMPPDREALDVLIRKYSVQRSQAGDV